MGIFMQKISQALLRDAEKARSPGAARKPSEEIRSEACELFVCSGSCDWAG